MAEVIETRFEMPAGYASSAVARYVWQLDDQTRRLLEGIEGTSAEELGWQPGPGANTMGMLLAHVAVAEAHICAVGVEGLPTSNVREVLGIEMDDDGLPLPEGGTPPAALRGKDLPWFADLIAKARQETKRVAVGLTDADLPRRIERPPRPDGSRRVLDVEWALYHLVEHLAGHSGQILLLRHLHRVLRPGR